MKQRVTVALALFLLVAILFLKPPFWSFGHGDFRGYWSAGYLLGRGENFSDPAQLMQVEREHTNWQEAFVVSSWNPPWLLPLLIPYTFVPFSLATWWWFLTALTLTFVATVLALSTPGRTAITPRHRLLALLFALTFCPTLITFLNGQVSVLVLFGLALFLYFWGQRRDGAAGLALVLTLVKPHLVYIALPIILLEAARLRRWRLWAGLAAGLTALTAIVFLLRPTFLFEYLQNTSGQGRLLQWLTPTLGGIIDATFDWPWARFMGLIILPLALFFWWRQRGRTDFQSLIDITLFLSVITAPFGWSYDVIVLIIPIMHLLVWLAEGKFGRLESAAIVTLLLLVNIASLYHRVYAHSEEEFFWIPIALALIYGWARLRLAKRPPLPAGLRLEQAMPANGS